MDTRRIESGILTPPPAGPHPEAMAAAQNISELLDQVARGRKLDAATIGSMRAMTEQILEAAQSDSTLPPDVLVSASDLLAILSDMRDPAPFDDVDTGHQVPEGNAVSMARRDDGVQKTLGQLAEEAAGESFATCWGKPAQPSGIELARALAPMATGKIRR